MKSSIIYVNFAPYENAGAILNFLVDNFNCVALFSFNFHHLGKKGKFNKLIIFQKGEIVNTKNLFDFQVPERLIFLFLPIRSAIILVQIGFYAMYLKFKYGKFHNYFTVNAFTAWVGTVLKSVGLVNKTIFWVWDYYPPYHKNKTVVFMRGLYRQFDKWATKSDMLIFLNTRVVKLRKEINSITKNDEYKIIPVGTTNKSVGKIRTFKTDSKIKLVFLGVVKKSQGLDLIFDNSDQLNSTFPDLEIDVIGGGPDLEYFMDRGERSALQVNFHGYLHDKDIDRLLRKSHIGIATYIPSRDNVSYYGDPSKIKRYLSFDLPVITTNVFEFSKELKKANAGILVNYHKPNELIDAIHTILTNYALYKKGSRLLNQKYYYKNLYPEMFKPF